MLCVVENLYPYFYLLVIYNEHTQKYREHFYLFIGFDLCVSMCVHDLCCRQKNVNPEVVDEIVISPIKLLFRVHELRMTSNVVLVMCYQSNANHLSSFFWLFGCQVIYFH